MKLMLGLLGVVAAMTYGVVTMAGGAPIGSLSTPAQLNVPAQVQSKVPMTGASTAAAIPAAQAPVAAPPVAAPAVAAAPIAVEGPARCDLPALLGQLQAIRKHGRLEIALLKPLLERTGCSAANLAALSSQSQPPNAGRSSDGEGDGEHQGGD